MKNKDYTYPLLLAVLILYLLFYGTPDIYDILKFKLMSWSGYEVCN